MVVAAALGQERLTLAKLSGVLLTLAGVGLALGEKAFQWDGAVRAWVGELAVFLRAVSAVAMLASVGFLAVLAAGEGFFGSLPASPRGAGWPSSRSEEHTSELQSLTKLVCRILL